MEALALHLIKAAILLLAVLGIVVPLSSWLERAWGTIVTGSAVGGRGMLQPVADGLKLLSKTSISPRDGDRHLFSLGPTLALLPPLVLIALIPFGNGLSYGGGTISLQIADLEAGTLIALALMPLASFGLVVAGWSSGYAYTRSAAVRTAIQVSSFSVVAGLAIAGAAMTGGTMQFAEIVRAQTATLGSLQAWNILLQPIGFLGLLAATFAYADSPPLDSGSSPQELRGGYAAAYSGLSLGLIILAARLRLIAGSLLIVTIYLGGWGLPIVATFEGPVLAMVEVVVVTAKALLVTMLIYWTRMVLPRPTMEQLLGWAWKVAIPLTVLNVPVTAYMLVRG